MKELVHPRERSRQRATAGALNRRSPPALSVPGHAGRHHAGLGAASAQSA